MIFFLEVDGQLKKCRVYEPYSGFMSTLNALRAGLRVHSDEHDAVTAELKKIAAQVVSIGFYLEAE